MLSISDAEWNVMETVWRIKSATAGDVIADLADRSDWSHRTIRTLLSRLVEKGALRTQGPSQKPLYLAAVSRAQCVRAEGRTFVDKVFGGNVGSLLAHFVKDPHVSREELEQLRRMLDEKLDNQPPPSTQGS